MKVLIEMSPVEALNLRPYIDVLLEASVEGDVATTTLESATKKAKKTKASKAHDEPAGSESARVLPNVVAAAQPVQPVYVSPVTPVAPTASPSMALAPEVANLGMVPAAQSVPQVVQIPTTGQRVFTIAEIALASAQLRDAGRLAELSAALSGFGVQAVTQLSAEQLQQFAQQLIVLGAKL